MASGSPGERTLAQRTAVSPHVADTILGVHLEALRLWTERNRGELEAAGVTVVLSEPTPWDKPARGVSLRTPSRDGEVWVWTSGECEVIVGDVASGNPEQVHYDLTSESELLDVLDGFRVRFLATPA
jgi:hypothetical protein